MQCIGIGIAYDKHCCAMHWIALLIIDIFVQCNWIALLMISMVVQCIGISMLMICLVINALYCIAYDKISCAMQ